MLQRIILHLARSPEFPDGSAERGYELVAPLNAWNHLDVQEWRNHKAECRARRFWPGEPDRHGALAHHGAVQGGSWAIHYAGRATDDDEIGVRLSAHRFVKDEYVSIREGDGHLRTFKITLLQPFEPTHHVRQLYGAGSS